MKNEFPQGKENYCPQCYFENDEVVLRKNCKHYKKKQQIEDLANFMHLEYERFAQKCSWDTNDKCKVAFNDLPEANKKTMFYVAESILEKIKNKIVDKATFESGVSSNGWYQIYKDDLDSIL